VNDLAGWHLGFEHVEGGKQGGAAVALVIVGTRTVAPRLHRQARLGAVERLDLALLVNREADGVGRRIDVEPDDILQLGDELRITRQLEASDTV